MDKLLVITGPTATGKTALAIKLAKKLNGEIISADSRQVYKFLDIGTGKETNFPQWGIDLVNPDYNFNVSDYVTYAADKIQEILGRGKLPIVAGGTGQYIKELLWPSKTLHVPPNEKLRIRLLHLSVDKLQAKLQEVDIERWNQMNNSDRNNPRRLIRAIEVAGQTASSQAPESDVLIIGLTAPKEVLFERIDKRVEERIALGMEKEKEKLKTMGYSPHAFGYSNEPADLWKQHEHAYAKRQMTYLKKLPNVQWFNIEAADFEAEVFNLVGRWYIKSDGTKTS